jgi:oligopeptide transport system permease protein
MLRYFVKRVFMMFLTLLVIISLTFLLMQLIPGDPFQSINALPDPVREALEKKYGLDKTPLEQYFVYMKNVILRFDLGDSIKYPNRSVNDIIKEGFPVSATLGLMGGILGIGIGLILGLVAGLNHGKFWDYAVIFIAILGVAIPSFVMASLMQVVFGVHLKWLPVARWGTFAHMIMPLIALSFGAIAFQGRMMRAAVIDVKNQDYIKTALAKGMSKSEVTRRHILRNALLPNITVMGPGLAGMLCGTFIIEQIFAIPGIGKHLVQSIMVQDYTAVMGITVFYAFIILSSILIVDILYGVIDPRIDISK